MTGNNLAAPVLKSFCWGTKLSLSRPGVLINLLRGLAVAALLYIVVITGLFVATGTGFPEISWFVVMNLAAWSVILIATFITSALYYRFTIQRYECSAGGVTAVTEFLGNRVDLLSYHMPWEKVAKATFYPQQKAIRLRNDWRSAPIVLWLYCAPDNYSTVQDTITRMATHARCRWKVPGSPGYG